MVITDTRWFRYAKYLNPEFHIWCNEVVRARMEGGAHEPATGLTPYDANTIGGIVKRCTGVVIREQLEVLLPALVREELASRSLLIRAGRTAGMIWTDAGLPRLKGAAVWFGNRLSEMDCQIPNGGRADIGGKAVRLFDPDKAALCLRNGMLLSAQLYADERRGQTKLHLIPGAKK